MIWKHPPTKVECKPTTAVESIVVDMENAPPVLVTSGDAFCWPVISTYWEAGDR